MSSVRHTNFDRAVVLSLLMVMMTQVGYLESMNPWTNGEETLDETNDVLETGGSGSSFAYANDKMSLGLDHTCAILGNGSMMCWGSDYHGQMGNGAIGGTTNYYNTAPISAGTAIDSQTTVALDAGSYHTCAILDDDSLKCWGRDNFGQLGDGGAISTIINNTNIPVSVDLGTGRTAFAVSAAQSNAKKTRHRNSICQIIWQFAASGRNDLDDNGKLYAAQYGTRLFTTVLSPA